jgi:O-antigen/teichoic acid export membrane protein
MMNRQSTLTLGDQLFSSASNALIVMAIARTSSSADFGLIALMLTGVSAGLAITRQALGAPLMLAISQGAERVRYSVQRSLTAAMLFGLAISFLVLGCGFGLHRIDIAVPIAAAAPVVLAQDVYRYAAISVNKSSAAFSSDACWAALSLAALVSTWIEVPGLTAPLMVWVWGASALVCCLGLAYATRIRPSVQSIDTWWKENLAHRLRFGSEGAIGSITVVSISTLATVIVGPIATAALRGASVLVGPLNILINALPMLTIPKSASHGDTLASVRKRLWPFGLLMSILAVGVGLAGIILPERLGRLILGESWVHVAPLLPFTGLEYFCLAWLACNNTALLAKAMSRQLLQLRVIHAIMSVFFSAAAAFLFRDALSMAVALAMSAAFMLVPSWKSGRSSEAESSAPHNQFLPLRGH